jgi:Rad3-related DNA helicase
MNFDSFLYQTAYAKAFKEHARNFMCIDECHNSENKLLDFVTLTISDRDLSVRLKEKRSAEEYADYFKEIDLLGHARFLRIEAQNRDDIRTAERMDNLISKLVIFFDQLEDNRWICDFIRRQRYRVVQIKPLFVNKFANSNLFSRASKTLMMSATILSEHQVMSSLGIDPSEAVVCKMPSSFPPSNRPIYLEPCGSLGYKNKHGTFPQLVKTVDKICKKYPDKKGIIHTHNFEIANLLLDHCTSKRRFLFQKNFTDKGEMLRKHAKSANSVIVAPAMHEGLDLIDDLSRFQIICKVPYPNQNDNPQLKERVRLSWDYYVWLTTLKIVQSYGRSVRHDEDWAHTYIVDSDFGRFFEMAADILPDWFVEAIQV